MKKAAFFSFLFLILGCSPSIEDMKEEVMAIHDKVMPEMGTINRLAKELKVIAGDSLSTKDQRIEIKKHIDALETADDAMMSWMAEYKAPGNDLSAEKAKEILQKEKEKISIVRDQMLNSISDAKALLSKLEKK